MSVKDVLVKASSSRSKPQLMLTARELPAIKNWKVGKKYQIIIDVEQVSISKGDEWDDEKGLRARFEVLKAKPCDEEYEKKEGEK